MNPDAVINSDLSGTQPVLASFGGSSGFVERYQTVAFSSEVIDREACKAA